MGSPFMSTISLVSIATSVPVPIPIPRFAWARAGASLIPSPTNATNFPWACIFLTTSTLSFGMTSAKILSMPSSVPIASAVFWLSPVRSATSIPILWSSVIACLELCLAESLSANMPTA